MRLIDVDALLTEVRECKVMQRSENTDYRTGYISAMSTVEGIIADELLKLTIDAIPVEWLKRMREHYLAVATVLTLWQKEQEAMKNGH